jgi:hypothetical protein
MKKCCLLLVCLIVLLAAGVAPALATDTAPAAPVWAFADGSDQCAQAPAATGSEAVGSDLFVPQPLFMDPPVCNPFCITTQCSKNSDCTAQPNGRCALACPTRGCCVY